jgi:hypothetical protein
MPSPVAAGLASLLRSSSSGRDVESGLAATTRRQAMRHSVNLSTGPIRIRRRIAACHEEAHRPANASSRVGWPICATSSRRPTTVRLP